MSKVVTFIAWMKEDEIVQYYIYMYTTLNMWLTDFLFVFKPTYMTLTQGKLSDDFYPPTIMTSKKSRTAEL